MSQRVPPIARIRLARSLRRVLAIPTLLVIAGGGAVAVGMLLVPGIIGTIVTALGALIVLIGLVSALVLVTVRLEVEESAVTVTWLGGGRTFPLTPGPVTRVRFRGENASRLRRGPAAFAWGIGGARLRGEESIEVVRLAPTPTAILVPTEEGRLAIAPARDDDLLDALSRAARARRRLDELSEASPPTPAPPEAEPAPAEADAAPEKPEEPEEPEEPPTILTGIQRAMLEQRLAEERKAELEAHAEAEAAAAAADEQARVAAEQAAAASVPTTELERAGQRRRREAPPVARLRRMRRPRPRAAFVLLPIIGAGLAWGVGLSLGRMPEPGTDLARLTSLALVLAGPATSVGALMALAFWPRLVGVVVAGGLAASVFVGRALLGA